MELLGLGILAVCFLIAIVVFDAVRRISRPPVWALQARTVQEAPAAKVVTPAVPAASSLAPATLTASRSVKVPMAA